MKMTGLPSLKNNSYDQQLELEHPSLAKKNLKVADFFQSKNCKKEVELAKDKFSDDIDRENVHENLPQKVDKNQSNVKTPVMNRKRKLDQVIDKEEH